jgi:biopolymer transport protein ExbD
MAAARAFRLPGRGRARRPSLTPMIDVVFLLLVFFMVAARFGADRALPLDPPGGGAGAWEGPPRLVTVAPAGVRLNGTEVAPGALGEALGPLMPSRDAPVILRGAEGARLEDLAAVLEALSAAGIGRVVLVE